MDDILGADYRHDNHIHERFLFVETLSSEISNESLDSFNISREENGLRIGLTHS